jgi:hypothetical protein
MKCDCRHLLRWTYAAELLAHAGSRLNVLFADLIAQQEGETPSEELLELGAKVRYGVYEVTPFASSF